MPEKLNVKVSDSRIGRHPVLTLYRPIHICDIVKIIINELLNTGCLPILESLTLTFNFSGMVEFYGLKIVQEM